MSLLSALWMQYRAGRMLKRMGKLNERYKVAIDRGDRHGAGFIHDDIIILDHRLSGLLDRWEANVSRSKAVRS